MYRSTKTLTALVAGVGISLAGAATAEAAPVAHKLNAADIAFLKSNEQVNLAEITLGKIVLRRAKGPYAKQLARVTIRDHRMAEKEVKAVARKDGVTLPTAPNAAQQKMAAELNKVHPRVALAYYKMQVAGHELSIKQTKSELKHGSRPNVLKYARTYLPVAQMHLRMAKADLHRLQNR